jgi:hypothetical protein
MTDCGAVTADLSHVNVGVQICRHWYLLVAHAGEEERMDDVLKSPTDPKTPGSKTTFVALYQPSGEQQMNSRIFRSAFRV